MVKCERRAAERAAGEWPEHTAGARFVRRYFDYLGKFAPKRPPVHHKVRRWLYVVVRDTGQIFFALLGDIFLGALFLAGL
jgi:hypothetical protein